MSVLEPGRFFVVYEDRAIPKRSRLLRDLARHCQTYMYLSSFASLIREMKALLRNQALDFDIEAQTG